MRRILKKLFWHLKPESIAKTCTCCGREYPMNVWIDLPGIGQDLGLDWRNCECGTTLVLPIGPVYWLEDGVELKDCEI